MRGVGSAGGQGDPEPVSVALESVSGQWSLAGVTADPTVVRFMGRAYSVALVSGEVSFTDSTDITRPIPLGAARAAGDGCDWHVNSIRDEHILTTPDLLDAIAALVEATRRAR